MSETDVPDNRPASSPLEGAIAGGAFSCILWEPQNPLNVGAAIRACRNFGVHDVRAVAPGFADAADILVTAPNSEAFVAAGGYRRVERFEEAVEGVHRLYALTARGREERQRRWRLDELLATLRPQEERVAFVFGREDSGLPNHIVDRCHGYVTFATAPDYTSLNLGQAVLLVFSRVFAHFGEPAALKASGRSFPPADSAHVERFFALAEEVLDGVDLFRGDQRENVLRTLRRSLLKADLDAQELGTFFALFRALERYLQTRDG